MQKITENTYKQLLQTSRMPKRLQRELSFRPERYDWSSSDFAVVATKANDEGLFICEVDHSPVGFYYQQNEVAATASGRRKPYICDFCYTWLRPSRSSIITFILPVKQHHTLSFRICRGLSCNANMRGLTSDTIHSRAQLREDLSDEDRLLRFRSKVEEVGRQFRNLGYDEVA